jgi:tripartite ATP-independent transporter DctP family solute receptor
MKYIVSLSLVIIGLILTIFLYPFKLFGEDAISFDDEQEGLSKQITIVFSHVVAENTPKGLAANRFAQLAAEKTNGLVKVEVFPNGTLYSDEGELNALMSNKVQMIAPSLSKLTKLAPEWGLFDLPFLFAENEEIASLLQGELGDQFLSLHEDRNIKGLALWSNGFKQMTSSAKPMLKPVDFIGQRFRIMASPIIEDQFKQLGAVPLAMPYDQVYMSLREEKFEGQENTISNIYSRRLYELQNYMTISNHGFLGYAVLMNKEFWDGLPIEVQEGLAAAMEETASWLMEESVHTNTQQLHRLEQESAIEIHYLSTQEKAEWLEKLEPVYFKLHKEVRQDFAREFIEERIDLMFR